MNRVFVDMDGVPGRTVRLHRVPSGSSGRGVAMTVGVVTVARRRLTLPAPMDAASSGRRIATTPTVDEMLNRDAAVAVGVSGGKDSLAVALAVSRYLDDIGHAGPRLLIHSDLGRVEWKDSLPSCERLAAHLGWELVVVKRKAGDMLARWQGHGAVELSAEEALLLFEHLVPLAQAQGRSRLASGRAAS